MHQNRVEPVLKTVRQSFNRSTLLARLLRLKAHPGSPSRPGLIMIQIDGLSQAQFEQALDRGKLPFLHQLIRQHHYQLRDLYSGLPSTTPAVQSELFYGIRGAVPAFSFRDHGTGNIVRMYEPEAAARHEKYLTETGNCALLENGSAYSDNFSGGAAESHFCPSAMGWGTALRAANPLALLALLCSNLYSFLRVALLLPLELGLALRDFVNGMIRGQDFIKELKFIPTRIGICILLRELCVIAAKIDISRGLPVIHVNFLGYDEQAHRRGPDSRFAHWTLKGIDDAIARLWRAGRRAPWRNYQLWVYSDHGQISVRPYHQIRGYTLEQAIRMAFDTIDIATRDFHADTTGSIQTRRIRLLGGRRFQRLFAVMGENQNRPPGTQLLMTALGPVAHLYLAQQIPDEKRIRIASELAREHQVPVVLTRDASGQIIATTATAEWPVPENPVALFGADHPFIDTLADDLQRLCEHPDAGTFVLLGWRHGASALSFAEENGAHGGISPQETNGFALLPGDICSTTAPSAYLRPADVRSAVFDLLGRPD